MSRPYLTTTSIENTTSQEFHLKTGFREAERTVLFIKSIFDDPYNDVAKHDLLALGVTTEMIPDLIETILDEKYYNDDDSYEGFPHLYAYIALGQLKTPAAIDGLILGVKKWAHSDWFEWFCEDMPDIFGEIGPVAIPSLIELLQDKKSSFDARTSALHYLLPISDAHPEERARCIAAIVRELEHFEDNDPELNGYIVMYLVADYQAIESELNQFNLTGFF